MKKIHEILKISPDEYNSLSKEEKTQAIINFLCFSDEGGYPIILKSIENDINLLYKTELIREWRMLAIFSKNYELEEKLKNQECSHASKFFTFKSYVKGRKDYINKLTKSFPETHVSPYLIEILDELELLYKEFARLGEASKGLKIPNKKNELGDLGKQNNLVELEEIIKVLKVDLTLKLKKIRQSASQFTYHFKREIEKINESHLKLFNSPLNEIEIAKVIKEYFTKFEELFRSCSEFTRRTVENKAQIELNWAKKEAKLKVEHENNRRKNFGNFIRYLSQMESERDEWRDIAIDLADEAQLLESAQKFLLKKAIRTQNLEQQRTFLITKAVELAGDKTKAEKKLSKEKIITQSYKAYKEQKNEIKKQNQQDHKIYKDRIKLLTSKNTYYQDQDTKLRNTIRDLQNQIRNHTCSGCHISDHTDYNQIKVEINSLKQDKQNLETKLAKKKVAKKNLATQIKEIQSDYQKQETELATQKEKLTKAEKTIQQFETKEKSWEQKEKELLSKQNELLAEIELLKNPPLTNANKEKVKQSVIVKEVIKEIIIKDLENKELGFNLSTEEKDKLNNLSLSEIESYKNELFKNKFNNLEQRERERERERERADSGLKGQREQFYGSW